MRNKFLKIFHFFLQFNTCDGHNQQIINMILTNRRSESTYSKQGRKKLREHRTVFEKYFQIASTLQILSVWKKTRRARSTGCMRTGDKIGKLWSTIEADKMWKSKWVSRRYLEFLSLIKDESNFYLITQLTFNVIYLQY